jgi:hypothetical protein
MPNYRPHKCGFVTPQKCGIYKGWNRNPIEVIRVRELLDVNQSKCNYRIGVRRPLRVADSTDRRNTLAKSRTVNPPAISARVCLRALVDELETPWKADESARLSPK